MVYWELAGLYFPVVDMKYYIILILLLYYSDMYAAVPIETAWQNCITYQLSLTPGLGQTSCDFHADSYNGNRFDTFPNHYACGPSCNISTSCTGTDTFDTSIGSCTTPVVCPPAGTSGTVAIKSFDTVEGKLVVEAIPIAIGGSQKIVQGGCEYEIDSTSTEPSRCHASADTADTHSVYCDKAVKSTGVVSPTVPPGTLPGQSVNGTEVINDKVSPDGKCIVDSMGNNVCSGSPQDNKACGVVNGTEICVDITTGTGSVNGQPVQSSEKNCGYVNGKPVCLADDGTSSTTKACVRNSGVIKCVNADVKQTETSTTTTNPDNSTTETKTETNNIIGRTDKVTTKTCTTSGCNSEITGGDPSTLGDVAAEAAKAECEKPGNKNTIGCADLTASSGVTAETLPSTSIGLSTFSYTSWGSGSCPAPVSIAHGKAIFDYSFYCEKLMIMKPILIMFGLFISLFIVMAGVKD